MAKFTCFTNIIRIVVIITKTLSGRNCSKFKGVTIVTTSVSSCSTSFAGKMTALTKLVRSTNVIEFCFTKALVYWENFSIVNGWTSSTLCIKVTSSTLETCVMTWLASLYNCIVEVTIFTVARCSSWNELSLSGSITWEAFCPQGGLRASFTGVMTRSTLFSRAIIYKIVITEAILRG